tara:strand:+ start:16509 stop:16730 length:222 start_codon:yes stop_codon:yes gene_type:complete
VAKEKKKCYYCDDYVEISVGAYRKVSGWAQIREQGGSNSLAFMSEPEAWAHSACIDRQKQIKSGRLKQTETLF